MPSTLPRPLPRRHPRHPSSSSSLRSRLTMRDARIEPPDWRFPDPHVHPGSPRAEEVLEVGGCLGVDRLTGDSQLQRGTGVQNQVDHPFEVDTRSELLAAAMVTAAITAAASTATTAFTATTAYTAAATSTTAAASTAAATSAAAATSVTGRRNLRGGGCGSHSSLGWRRGRRSRVAACDDIQREEHDRDRFPIPTPIWSFYTLHVRSRRTA